MSNHYRRGLIIEEKEIAKKAYDFYYSITLFLVNETITGEELMKILESQKIRTFDPNGYES